MTRALMLQGTASGVGKSVLTAGLCRLLARRGVRVAPFKPQNMSNNAAVTCDGGEIGRAQALQALACGLEPHSDMNPVLIKPEADGVAQLIVQGQPFGTLEARRFKQDRAPLLPQVLQSFERLKAQYDLILVEGAGSPAEPNLRVGDIANMGFAQAANVPVWLIGDIDRGGVFSALSGTLDLLAPTERDRVQALIINRFRGEGALLTEALDWLGHKTGKRLAGVVPYVPDLELPEEDALYRLGATQGLAPGAALQQVIRIAAVLYPRASNLDDLDPLAGDPQVALSLARTPTDLLGADLIVLPGSKQVGADLAWLHDTGMVTALARHLRYGGQVLGICGGLQMLGQAIADPHGVEHGGAIKGLGWLPVATVMGPTKKYLRVDTLACYPNALPVRGYEIRYGDSAADPDLFPFHARSQDGQVWGTYLHGLFDSGQFRAAWLADRFGIQGGEEDQPARTLRALDRLADTLAASLDPELIAGLMG